MNVEEIPLAFECDGDTLIGIVHRPESPSHRGVLSLVAGGPQYRGGCCRQLVYMGRDFASHGIPVMRFDHRGLGDGEGKFLDFLYVEKDLAAAIAAFKQAVPELREVVLWGGCNAASGIMINAHRYPEVTGLILSNPYAHSEETQAVVVRKHYIRRLKDPAFWTKVLKLRFNPLPYIQSALRSTLNRIISDKAAKSPLDQEPDRPFTDRMLSGFKRFQGQILLIMSGQSLTSEEFDVLVANSPEWQQAYDLASVQRIEFPLADQTFSTVYARDEMIVAARNWLLSLT